MPSRTPPIDLIEDLNEVPKGLTEEMLQLLKKAGYSEKAIEYFKNRVNMGIIKDADYVHDYTGSCGDTLRIYLKFNHGVIKDASFQYLGCPGAAASASAITNIAKGKTLEEAKKVTEKDILKELEGLPESKFHCAKLAVTTLRRAIRAYEALGPFVSKEQTMFSRGK
jgi:nitrogen fixation NifU-like protein